MVVSDPDIHRAARLHLERHGDEAVTKAHDMVRNLKDESSSFQQGARQPRLVFFGAARCTSAGELG